MLRAGAELMNLILLGNCHFRCNQAIDKAVANTRPSPEEALTSSKEVSEHARMVPLPPAKEM
jgi:hypothetical protein